MIRLNNDHEWGIDSELRQAIETLASYICATDRPREALLSAQALLRREVRQTDLAARAYSGQFQGRRA